MLPETIWNDFGGFWNYLADSNSIFGVVDFFLRFEFLVCSGFNHMQCDCTCACAVAFLHPHNSIPNDVVSFMIHDNMNKHIQIKVIRLRSSNRPPVDERKQTRAVGDHELRGVQLPGRPQPFTE